MKKIILGLYILLASLIYSFDYRTDLELKYRENSVDNYNEDRFLLESSLKLEENYKNLYFNLTLKNYSDDIDEIEIFRAYGDYYGANYGIGLGKQRIVWGSSYLYNLTDVFNEMDIENPKREKTGVEALRLKYHLGATSKIEGVYYKKRGKEYSGIKYFSTYRSFEYVINYIEDRKGFVLETKGDIGIGVWSQLALKTKEYVIGGDYSFDINYNPFYLVCETMYSDKEKLYRNYMMYNYSLNDIMSIGQSVGFDSEGESIFYNIFYDWVYNDYVSFNARVNRYVDYGGVTYLEAEIGVKASF